MAMPLNLFPPSPEMLAFLDAIKEAPEDDMPRLVFADWLEERGSPRGEFIRVQVELARLADVDPRRTELERREGMLFYSHQAEWLAPWGKWLRKEGRKFVRGLAHIKLPAHALLNPQLAPPDGPRAFAWVEKLTLTEVRDAGQFAGIVAAEHFEHLTALCIPNSQAVDGKAVRALANSPHVRRLTELELSHLNLRAAGVRALADSPHLVRLTRLSLDTNLIGRKGVEALAASPHLTRLTHLNLDFCHVRGDGIRPLAESAHRDRLVSLRLTANDLGEGGAEALTQAGPWPALRQLTLRYNGIGDGGVARLAAGDFPALADLDLAANDIGDAGVAAIANAPQFASLRRLDLYDNDVGDAGLEALIASPYLSPDLQLVLSDRSSPVPGRLVSELLERFHGAAVRFLSRG